MLLLGYDLSDTTYSLNLDPLSNLLLTIEFWKIVLVVIHIS
jgi:hypothetical protein